MPETQTRIYHAVHMSCAASRKKICPICGKTYYATPEHGYVAHVGSTSHKEPVCSYTCMRSVERREEEEARKKQEEKQRIEEEKRMEREKKRHEKRKEKKKQALTPEMILLQIEECTQKYQEVLMLRDTPAYRRLTETERRAICRKIGYWLKRRKALEEELALLTTRDRR